ncbi:MAG TPA: hypothetical protein VJM74_05690, partial [Nitrososphaeraceae archaeon]|nr:hypothetical protein [Nitrososphaeraceae archaeon]
MQSKKRLREFQVEPQMEIRRLRGEEEILLNPEDFTDAQLAQILAAGIRVSGLRKERRQRLIQIGKEIEAEEEEELRIHIPIDVLEREGQQEEEEELRMHIFIDELEREGQQEEEAIRRGEVIESMNRQMNTRDELKGEEITSNLKLLLEHDREVKIFYRALAVYKSRLDNAKLYVRQNTYGLEEDEALRFYNDGGQYYRNVINWNMNECVDPSNFNFFSSGKLHSITVIPISFLAPHIRSKIRENDIFQMKQNIPLNEEETANFDFNRVFFSTLTSSYEMATFHNSIFGVLTFTVNSHNHNHLSESLAFILLIANRLLSTGGLGGLSKDVIRSYFGSFTINTSSSSGGVAVGSEGGVRFFKSKIGPFPVDDLFFESYREFVVNYSRLNGAVLKKYENSLQYMKNSEDMIDIEDYMLTEGMTDPERVVYEKSLVRRYEIYQRRMEDVAIKLFPHVIEPINVVEATPRHYYPHIIHPDPDSNKLIVPDVPAKGDVIYRPLDPNFHAVPLEDTGGRITYETFKKVTQQSTDVSKPLSGFGDSVVDDNTFINENLKTDNPQISTTAIYGPLMLNRPVLDETPGDDDLLDGSSVIHINRNVSPIDAYKAIFRVEPGLIEQQKEKERQVISGGPSIEMEGEEYELVEIQPSPEREVQLSPSMIEVEEISVNDFKENVATYSLEYEAYLKKKTGLKEIPFYYHLIRILKKLFEERKIPNELLNIFQANSKSIDDTIKLALDTYTVFDFFDEYLEKLNERALKLDKMNQKTLRNGVLVRIGTLKQIKDEFEAQVGTLYQTLETQIRDIIPDPRFLILIKKLPNGIYSSTYLKWIREATQLINRGRKGYLGCNIDNKSKLDSALKRMPQLYCPDESMDNNCFLRCLIEALHMQDIIKSDNDYNILRLEHKILHNDHLSIDEIQTYADRFLIDIHLWAIQNVTNCEISKIIAKNVYKSKGNEVIYNHAKPTINQKFVEYQVIQSSPKELSHADDREILSKQINRMDLLVQKNHCYLMLNKEIITSKVKCSLCKQWITGRGFYSKHINSCFYCYECRRSYSNKRKNEHQCQGKSDYFKIRISGEVRKTQELVEKKDEDTNKIWKHMRKEKVNKKTIPLSQVWFADIEAFSSPDEESIFYPYAVGIINGAHFKDSDPILFYGKNAMRDYLDFLDTIEGVLYYFNGSAFDNFLTIRAMVQYNKFIITDGFVKHSNRIISFQYHKKLKVNDLYLYINSSLDNACKSWGVPQEVSKKEFDHSKVYDWKSIEEHKEEVKEYLKYDVISLAHLYHNYSTTMFKCFGKNITKSITPSQYAIQCWSSMNPELMEHLYIPKTGKEEDDDRAAYYGGRVMCQRKEYLSENYMGPHDEYEYDFIDDYIIDADVNSLYPTAQIKFQYAYGHWKYIIFGATEEKIVENPGFIYGTDEDQKIVLDRMNYLQDEQWMNRCCFCVDIRCPKDLITSFLLSRNEKGEIEHNLYDKMKSWYWGNELAEAIILGYRITYVHEIKEFDKLGDIFKNYVEKCWNGRKANPKPSLINLAYKCALVCLTGKFGQKSSQTSIKIYKSSHKVEKRNEKNFDIILQSVKDFDLIYPSFPSNEVDEEDDNLIVHDCALILELENDNKDPHYPVYLSGQILANSRVYMSRIMRTCNAYFDPSCAIYYTDTDSLLLPSRCLPNLERAKYIGNDLGQLSCDLHDHCDGFSKIVRAVWSATKGPYSVIYLNPGENKLLEKVRVKGIPHIAKPFLHSKKMEVNVSIRDKENLNHLIRWIESPFKFSVPSNLVKTRFYMFKDLTEGEGRIRVVFEEHINADLIQKMMNRTGELYCFYGGMKRAIKDDDGQILSVKPSLVQRMACKTDWWSKGKRIFIDADTINETRFALSYPPGYSLMGARTE